MSTTTQQYRKKPVVVTAIQWTGDNTGAVREFTATPGGPAGFIPAGVQNAVVWVEANQSWLPVERGSWIIRDASGFYPCLPARFTETYEPVTSQPDTLMSVLGDMGTPAEIAAFAAQNQKKRSAGDPW